MDFLSFKPKQSMIIDQDQDQGQDQDQDHDQRLIDSLFMFLFELSNLILPSLNKAKVMKTTAIQSLFPELL